MKLGITSKLILAIVTTNVVVAIAMSVAGRISFETGFLDYVREREAQRLEGLATLLADGYREHGDWQFLRGNDALWRALNKPDPHDRERGPRKRPAPGAESGDGPFGPRPDREFSPPPPRRADAPGGGSSPAAGDAASEQRFPRRRQGPGPPPPPPLSLLDAERRFVVGYTDSPTQSLLRPIVVDGSTVGWLAGAVLKGSLSGADLRLREQQLMASWLIGGLALLLAAGVAVLLSRIFLAPVKQLTSGTHRLAAGNYATRVAATSRDELGQLTQDFNRLARILEQNDEIRRNFIADMSHELRTPLAVLRGEFEALEDGVRSLTPDTLESLQAEVATLSKLVDDLFALSLADVGALTFRTEEVDMVELVSLALNAFRERLAARRIALEADLSAGQRLIVKGDPDRLRQLLSNLLENCVRYIDPGGRLRVTVRRLNERLRLDFQDSEPGVPEKLLPRLFERLFRVEGSRNRESGGAGLGLSLCQSIVEAHEGEIEAKPSPLGGLWIAIDLPLLKAERV